MTIDIKPISADRLQKNEISSLFIPVKKFEKIVERETIYLMGPKGSGKSMVLHYMSLPVQFERFKNGNEIDYDLNNLGIYLKCNEHYFGSAKEQLDNNGEPAKQWQDKFTHLFNLNVCEVLFRDLTKFKDMSFKITSDEESKVSKIISDILGLQSCSSFENLRDTIKIEIHKTYNKLNKKNIDQSTANSFLSELQGILKDNISDFENKWLVILLDEYHELSYHQQQIISEILAIRQPLFKIGILPPEFSTERQKDEKYIQLMSDFEVVDVGTKNITHNSPDFEYTRNFFKDMANKRLEPFGLDIETLLGTYNNTTDEINDERQLYSGFENFVLISSGNARTFLKLLNTTFSEWSTTGNKIPDTIQHKSVKKFATQLMDGIDYIPKISPPLFRSIILKIGLLFSNYIKQLKRPYLQIGIKDPQNLTEETDDLLSLALERNYLLEPSVERSSRQGFKLSSITLHNALLPYFDLPFKTHQVYEITASDVEKLVDRRSEINGTSIVLPSEIAAPVKLKETLVPYLDTIHEIVEHARNKELGVFIGSGISTELGYPSGPELAKKIARHFRIEYTGEELPTIAERVLEKRQRGDLIKFIRDELHKSKKGKSTSYSKLLDFGLDEIYTTNWDNSIEEQFKSKFPHAEKIVRDGHLAISGSRKPLIYKLHGDFDHPDMFIITNDDSSKIEETRPAIINAFKHDLFRKHFLFLGYGMDDLDFRTIFYLIKKIQGTMPLTSYAVTLGMPADKSKILQEKGISMLTIRGETLIEAIHKGLSE